MRRNLKNSWRRLKSKEIPGFSVMSLSRPRAQLNTLQSSHNHHHQSGKIGWNVTVQSKTSQVEERKEKTSCKKFNILLRNQQKPSFPHRGCTVHDPLVGIRRERRGDKHTKMRQAQHGVAGRWPRTRSSLRMQPRCDGVLPLDAVKSIATVKLSCVLVGD